MVRRRGSSFLKYWSQLVVLINVNFIIPDHLDQYAQWPWTFWWLLVVIFIERINAMGSEGMPYFLEALNRQTDHTLCDDVYCSTCVPTCKLPLLDCTSSWTTLHCSRKNTHTRHWNGASKLGRLYCTVLAGCYTARCYTALYSGRSYCRRVLYCTYSL